MTFPAAKGSIEPSKRGCIFDTVTLEWSLSTITNTVFVTYRIIKRSQNMRFVETSYFLLHYTDHLPIVEQSY